MTEINWIDIDNFRGISHLHYEPKRINLIIGRNNAGKTTILDAVYDNVNGLPADNVKDGDRRYEVKAGSNFSVINSDLHELVMYDLNGDVPHSIVMTVDDKIDEIVSKLCAELKISPDAVNEISLYMRNNLGRFIFVCDGKADFIINYQALIVYNNVPLFKGLQDIIQMSLSGNERSSFKSGLNSVDNGNSDAVSSNSADYAADDDLMYKSNRLAGEFLWRFTDIFNPDKLRGGSAEILYLNNDDISGDFRSIDNIRLIELENIVKEYNILQNVERLTDRGVIYRQESGEFYEIPYYMHGNGFIRLINFISKIMDAEDGILLIEEPENHMHPGYLSVFVENLMMLADKFNVQVFMTTHSYDLIDELCTFPESDEEKGMIQISRVVRRGCEHEIYNYTADEAFDEMINFKMDLRGT